MKTKRMRWVRNAECMGEMRKHTVFWLKHLKGRDLLEDLGGCERIILEWILGKYGGKVWARCIWLRTGTSGGLL